jgi:hypothetical protein
MNISTSDSWWQFIICTEQNLALIPNNAPLCAKAIFSNDKQQQLNSCASTFTGKELLLDSIEETEEFFDDNPELTVASVRRGKNDAEA